MVVNSWQRFREKPIELENLDERILYLWEECLDGGRFDAPSVRLSVSVDG